MDWLRGRLQHNDEIAQPGGFFTSSLSHQTAEGRKEDIKLHLKGQELEKDVKNKQTNKQMIKTKKTFQYRTDCLLEELCATLYFARNAF